MLLCDVLFTADGQLFTVGMREELPTMQERWLNAVAFPVTNQTSTTHRNRFLSLTKSTSYSPIRYTRVAPFTTPEPSTYG